MAVQDDIFNYLSGSRLQSQVESPRQMMVFMSLVVVWIGQFCRGVIGRQNVKSQDFLLSPEVISICLSNRLYDLCI